MLTVSLRARTAQRTTSPGHAECFAADKTINRFIYDGPAYERQREALRKAAGDAAGYETIARKLVLYVSATIRITPSAVYRDQGRGDGRTTKKQITRTEEVDARGAVVESLQARTGVGPSRSLVQDVQALYGQP